MGTLVGQRLTAIVPERLHEAHLAGYTRYQVTRRPRLVGKSVRVPARRRDGSEVEVELTLDAFSPEGGRQMFVGLMNPVVRETPAAVEERAWLRLVDLVVEAMAADPSPARPAQVLALIGEHTGAAVGSWWTVDGAALCCQATWSADPDSFRSFESVTSTRRFTLGQGLPGRVWSEERALWVSDVVRDANFPRVAVALQHGLRTAYAFPVLEGGAVTGVIELFSEEMREADDTLLAALQSVGRVLGLSSG